MSRSVGDPAKMHEVTNNGLRELGDFFDGLCPAAYAQEAPPVDDESDDETKTPS